MVKYGDAYVVLYTIDDDGKGFNVEMDVPESVFAEWDREAFKNSPVNIKTFTNLPLDYYKTFKPKPYVKR